MPFPSLAPVPASSDPTNFAAYMDAFLAKLPAWQTEADAVAAAMTAVAAGGAVSLQYTFSTTTTDADPGAGLLRLSAATQNTSTVIRADLLGRDTSDYTGMLNLLDDSTSTNKGYITLRHATTPTKWLVFSVASLASPAGYRNVTVACVASSAASPFANGDALLFDFSPNGDKGNTGDTGATGATFTGGSLTTAINTARATVESAATTADIWAAAGNQIAWTGTVTCTGFPAAPQAGAERVLICAGAAPFTASANMLIDGVTSGNTVTCAANDTVIVRAVTTTQFKLSIVDGTNAVGFRTIPQNSQSVAYTTVLADSGKHLLHPSADTTARTFTIPANASVAYPIGTAITFVNQASAGVMTIAITTDTMRLAGAGTTGSRTLAANGVATAIKLTATEWIISGMGLT